MKRVIHVTKRDILHAMADRSDGCFEPSISCPVARACNRAFRERKIEVLEDVVNTARFTQIKLPGKARRFITAFDAKRFVQPFTFTLSFWK